MAGSRFLLRRSLTLFNPIVHSGPVCSSSAVFCHHRCANTLTYGRGRTGLEAKAEECNPAPFFFCSSPPSQRRHFYPSDEEEEEEEKEGGAGRGYSSRYSGHLREVEDAL